MSTDGTMPSLPSVAENNSPLVQEHVELQTQPSPAIEVDLTTGSKHRIVDVDGKQEEREEGAGEAKRIKFGSRHLDDKEKVWDHNAWDDVEWNEEQLDNAKKSVLRQSESPVPEEMKGKYETEAGAFWDAFYNVHDNKFFKNRNWLFTEFPELALETRGNGDGKIVNILEVGCGVGNTVFPILQANPNDSCFVHACDISSTAVSILKNQAEYDTKRCHAFVHDVSSDEPLPIEDGSLDIVILIFILSAIHPSKFSVVLEKLTKALRPGGVLLFRDYGRYDLAQLRFKKNRYLEDNFYVRGDGTRVYFFTKEEMDSSLTSAGLVCQENGYDKRLLVNRKRNLQMFRVWLQCKYMKPLLQDKGREEEENKEEAMKE